MSDLEAAMEATFSGEVVGRSDAGRAVVHLPGAALAILIRSAIEMGGHRGIPASTLALSR